MIRVIRVLFRGGPRSLPVAAPWRSSYNDISGRKAANHFLSPFAKESAHASCARSGVVARRRLVGLRWRRLARVSGASPRRRRRGAAPGRLGNGQERRLESRPRGARVVVARRRRETACSSPASSATARLPEARKGLYIQDLNGRVPPGEHRWLVHCLDWKTGKTLWTREAAKAMPGTPIHIKNTYASETPVTDGERVYAYFGNIGLFCYDRDGKELWSRKWPAVKTRMGWGTAASPALHGDRLFVVNDNEDKSYLVALDKRTGKTLWEVERDEKSNWATPFVWENEKRTELVTAASNRVRSYDLDGKLLWELKGMSIIAIPTPFAANGLLYVTSGYVLDPKRPVFAIRPGAEGDISLKEGETANKWVAWCQRQAGPYHPTPLVHGDYLYVLLRPRFSIVLRGEDGQVGVREAAARRRDGFHRVAVGGGRPHLLSKRGR